MSPLIPIDCQSIHATLLWIEFPCIIENENAVIQGLHFNQLASKQATSSDAVVEWKRPIKPLLPSPSPSPSPSSPPSSSANLTPTHIQRPRFIHPLVGRIVEPVQLRLVLRLRRNKASREIMSMACLGRMTESIVFGREMADFQFCVPQQRTDFLAPLSHLSECANVKALDAMITHLERSTGTTNVNSAASLFPPPFFTAYQIPIIYNYAAYPLPPPPPSSSSSSIASSELAKNLPIQASPKNPRALRHLAAHYRSIYDNSIPSIMPSVPTATLSEDLVLRLADLLQQRPIWSSLAIYRQFELSSEHASLKRALKSLAFYWYDGPWRGCWNRIDYDPRLTPDARMYQILELRSLAKEKPSNTAASHILDETGIQSNLYQYIDVKDKDALILLANRKEWSSSFHSRLGWWRPGFKEKMMAILKLKYRGTSNSGLEISRGIRFPRRPRPSKRKGGPLPIERNNPPQDQSSLTPFEDSSDFEEAERDDHEESLEYHDGVDDEGDDDIYQIFEDEIYSDDD